MRLVPSTPPGLSGSAEHIWSHVGSGLHANVCKGKVKMSQDDSAGGKLLFRNRRKESPLPSMRWHTFSASCSLFQSLLWKHACGISYRIWFLSLSLIQTLGWLADLWTRLQVCAFCVSATKKTCEPRSVLLTGRSDEQQVGHGSPPKGLLVYVSPCASRTLHFSEEKLQFASFGYAVTHS